MSKKEFLEGLGPASPEDKVTEIAVPEDQLEKVMDKPPDEEIKDMRGRLENIRAILGKLDGTVQASPAIIQGEQVLDTLGELRNRFEELEVDIGAAKCPECGKIVGWNVLPVEKYDEREVNPNKQWLFPSIIIPLVYGKRCPVCKYFEKVEEQKDIEEEE